MALSFSVLQLPLSQFKTLTLSSPFLHGSSSTSHLTKKSFSSTVSISTSLPTIQAIKTMQGKVVCATSNKTVAVEVVRLAAHPKYHRRIRYKKKYQAHDAENQFKVGDVVQLLKSRPISKTKTFIAVAAPDRHKKNKETESVSQDLGLPLESQQS